MIQEMDAAGLLLTIHSIVMSRVTSLVMLVFDISISVMGTEKAEEKYQNSCFDRFGMHVCPLRHDFNLFVSK